MININKALKNNRILKSLTGLSIEKFKELVPYFETVLKEENGKRIKNDKNRQRKAGGGSKPTLENSEAKLFYILFYVKDRECRSVYKVLSRSKRFVYRWYGTTCRAFF